MKRNNSVIFRKGWWPHENLPERRPDLVPFLRGTARGRIPRLPAAGDCPGRIQPDRDRRRSPPEGDAADHSRAESRRAGYGERLPLVAGYAGLHAVCRAGGSLSRRLPQLPAGHGAERGAQDQPLQPGLSLLLRLRPAGLHRAHRGGPVGNRRQPVPGGGPAPALFPAEKAHGHRLRLPGTLYGD